MFKKNNPAWNKGTKGITGRARTGKNKKCENCDSIFYVCASVERRAKPRFCSSKCYVASRWGNRKERRICVVCESVFIEARGTLRKCCSRNCRIKRHAYNNTAEKSRFWRGGKCAPYIGEWKQRRIEALQRDGFICVTCGSGDRIQVHHIIPYRYSMSHAITNLKTLCRSCHSREEYAVNKVRQIQLHEASTKRKKANLVAP